MKKILLTLLLLATPHVFAGAIQNHPNGWWTTENNLSGIIFNNNEHGKIGFQLSTGNIYKTGGCATNKECLLISGDLSPVKNTNTYIYSGTDCSFTVVNTPKKIEIQNLKGFCGAPYEERFLLKQIDGIYLNQQ